MTAKITATLFAALFVVGFPANAATHDHNSHLSTLTHFEPAHASPDFAVHYWKVTAHYPMWSHHNHLTVGAMLAATTQSRHLETPPARHPKMTSHYAAPHSHDDLARTEMHLYAARHLSKAVGRPHTFGGTDNWDSEWTLRWMDFVDHGHAVRVCHATKKHHHGVRYATRWDPRKGRWSTWEPVQ